MPFKRICLVVAVSLVGCGGGSGDSSRIEGTWRGDLIQGVIFCDDGTAIAACGGCSIGKVQLVVDGSDDIDSRVEAFDDTCRYEGPRTAEGFVATATGECSSKGTSISFSLLEGGNAALKYRYDPTQVEPGPTGVRCSISPDALLTRD